MFFESEAVSTTTSPEGIGYPTLGQANTASVTATLAYLHRDFNNLTAKGEPR